MIQTSKRPVTRRTARKRSLAKYPPRLNETHPYGARAQRLAFIAMFRKSEKTKAQKQTKGAFGKRRG